MRRGLLLGGVDRDRACAVVVGFVEDRRLVLDLETIFVLDADRRLVASQSGWLNTPDALDRATRAYLLARRALAAAPRDRDRAARRLMEARQRVRRLLEERGVLERAREDGMVVVGDALTTVG